MKKSSTRIALVLVALVMLFTLLAVSASAALVNTTATIETARGQENYTLFNSGITGSGRPGNSSNSNCKSLTNNGKDLYCTYNATIQLGLPFKLNYDLTEKATLTIRSYDVDEYYSYSSPERDLVYLVDETAGTRKQLPGYLKGMNEQWNTTVFEIDPSWFVKGHIYHFENYESVSGWHCWFRSVDIKLPTATIAEILNHEFTASINNSGKVTTNLYLQTRENATFDLEYSVVYIKDGDQVGSAFSSITATTAGANKAQSIQCETSKAGTYEVVVMVKSGGAVIATYSAQVAIDASSVTYNANGGSNNLPTDNTAYKSGDTVTVLFNYLPSLYGYDFLGWSTNKDATAPEFTANGTKTFTIGSTDVTLYAVWAKHNHQWSKTSETKATCEQSGATTYDCLTCGEQKTEYQKPLGHKYVEVEAKAATCTEDGYVIYKCDRCGTQKKDNIAANGHDFGNDNKCDNCPYEKPVNHTHSYNKTVVAPTCIEMGYTVYTCSCGHSYTADFVQQSVHKWDEGKVTKAATCTEDGIKTYTCTVCKSASYNEKIAAAHTWTETVTTAATCTTDGEIYRSCTVCFITERTVIPAGHKWNEGKVTKEPTCEEKGEKTCTCTVCGATEKFELKELGHHYENMVCTRCNKHIGGNPIDPQPSRPDYGMWFELEDVVSNYGPDLIDEYGLLLDYNENAKFEKVGVYLTQDGTMWRRCIAATGEDIDFATYVPYLAYDEEIKYSGLTSPWINTFRLSENSDGIWCYSNYATIGVNLEDRDGNPLLSLYDIGIAGKETRLFTDLDAMIAWLKEGKATAEVGSATACPGQTVTVDVVLSEFEPIKSIMIAPEYDDSILELQSAKWLISEDAEMAQNWKPATGNAVLAYEYPTDSNGPVLRMTFKIKETAKLGDVASVGISTLRVKGYDVATETEYDLNGTVKVGAITVGHVYSTDWTSDADTHWHACKLCGAKADEAAHTNSAAWSSGVDNHWHECTVCGYESDLAAHEWDNVCDPDCNVCGKTRPVSHNYSKDWKTDESSHWHECANCGDKKDLAKHGWDEGVLLNYDLDNHTGNKKFTCKACEYTETRVVDVYKVVIDENKVGFVPDKHNAGRTVSVNINFSDIPFAKALGVYDITYDKTKLELVKGKWSTEDAVINNFDEALLMGALAFAENTSMKDVTLTLTFKVLTEKQNEVIKIDCKTVVKRVVDNVETYVDTVVIPGSVKTLLRGDMDNNGKVDSNDAIYLLRNTLLPSEYPITQDGDMDGNGKTDSNDAIYLLRYTLEPKKYPLHPLT